MEKRVADKVRNNNVVKNEDGSYSLQFEQGTLSYINITNGLALKSVKNKNRITSIVFGKKQSLRKLIFPGVSGK